MGIMHHGFGTSLEGCGRCVKWSLLLANLIIFIGGIVTLSVGLWTLTDKSYIERLLRNDLFISSAYILGITGVVIIFITFLGCFGALKEVKCMLLGYFIFLFLMFVVLVIGGVLGFVFREQVADNLRPEMKHTIEKYDPRDPADPITWAWDNTQSRLKCCGMSMFMRDTNDEDPWRAWRMNPLVNPTMDEFKVPQSCCRLKDEKEKIYFNCTAPSQVDPSQIWREDCLRLGLVFVKDHAKYMAAVAFGFSGAMFSGMLLSVMLFRLIDRTS